MGLEDSPVLAPKQQFLPKLPHHSLVCLRKRLWWK